MPQVYHLSVSPIAELNEPQFAAVRIELRRLRVEAKKLRTAKLRDGVLQTLSVRNYLKINFHKGGRRSAVILLPVRFRSNFDFSFFTHELTVSRPLSAICISNSGNFVYTTVGLQKN